MKGKISISRYSSSQPPYSGISIDVEDALSGVRFLRVDMTPEQFGNVVSGLGYVDCEFDLGGTEYVGMKREYKHVWIDLQEGEFVIQDKIRQKQLLLPYEVDGWKGRASDLANSHKRDGQTNAIKVLFERYVKVEE